MSASDVFENGLLSLIFENANYANVGDATGLRGSSTAGVFYIGLATASPGDTGTQSTSQAAYGNYARESVARSTSGWSVASGVADNDAAIEFPASSDGPESETDFSIGSDASGTGNLFLYGALSATLVVNAAVTPSFAAGALDVTLT